ncbi:MAG: glycoside hydrolase family 5 protein, partial [Bacteroidota bacterium]
MRPLFTSLFILTFFISSAQQVPFERGINLTGWFQATSPRQIQFSKYNKTDFEQIKSLGCDVIRLPINLHFMTDGEPDYTIDPLFLEFLDQAVAWSEELGLHLIFDNHTFSPSENTDPNIGVVLEKVWLQMANHYKDRYENIYYEVLNEPHGISDFLWNNIQQSVVETIRTVDTTHTIIVGGAGWNSYYNLELMPKYEDDNLIYTFHFYDPFVFTHQGATWTNPSMGSLQEIPFPYKAEQMPDLPNNLLGTWVQFSHFAYPEQGNVDFIKELIDIAVQFREERGVPIYCGEFGVYQPNSQETDRVFWYDAVRSYLEAQEIPWTIWDYHGGFGIFKEGGNDLFQHDLNTELLGALGWNVPEQTAFIPFEDTVGFAIYTDFIEKGLFESSFGSGELDYYS